MTWVRRLPALVLTALIRGYQRVISPWTPASCRYYPSCSQYALVAVQRHGALRGGWLALRRLGRCHPWAAGGVDHVPPARGVRTSGAACDHPHGDEPAPAAPSRQNASPTPLTGA